MALHKDFPSDPHAILDPAIRWFPADESLRNTAMNKLMPPLVSHDDMKEIAYERYDAFDATRRAAEATEADAKDLRQLEDLDQKLKRKKKES